MMPIGVRTPRRITINRATVVRCAISATRNYLKLHGPTELNPLFSNNRAITLKLCTRSRPPLFEFPKVEHLLQIPVVLAAQPVPNFPRLRALALFGRRSVERAEPPCCRRPKTYTWHKVAKSDAD